jgi:beta-lactamase regulating signal transducer with metallopeptidase domain
MTFAVALLWKSTVVLVAAIVAVRLAHRTRASVRHGLLVATFALLALLPLGSWALPTVAVPILPAGLIATSDRHGDVLATADSSPAGSRLPSPESASTTPGAVNGPKSGEVARAAGAGNPEGPGFSPGILGIRAETLTTLIAALWAAGAAGVLAGLIVGILRVQRLRRTALPSREAHMLLHTIGRRAATIPVDVVVHEGIQSPMTCGAWRLAIVLPRDANAWSDAAMMRALVHELEHVARRDWLTQISARAICALYWFHPLAWMAYRQLCLEAEHACDDAVVAREDGTMYADQLVTLARRMAARPAVAVLGMAQRSDLAARVSAVLDASRARGRAGVLRTGIIAATAATMLLALAPLQLVAQGPPPADAGSPIVDAGSPIADARSPIADAGSPIGDAGSPVQDVRLPIEKAESPTAVATAIPREGADGQRRSPRFDRVLVEAADEGDIAAVRQLLDGGANVDATVLGDGTPLIVAAREGHIELVRVLIDRGADLNLGVPGDGNPLIMAAREGHLAIVQLLLDGGADVNVEIAGDENALIQASASGHLEVVQLLVARGAAVNARVWDGGSSLRPGEWRTPLNMATRGGHREVAEFLRARGAVP